MAQYPHVTFPTQITNADGTISVAVIPNPGLTEQEKAVIQLALDGESLFVNQIEQDILDISTEINVIITRLNFLNSGTGVFPDPIVPNYPPLYQQLDGLIQELGLLRSQLTGIPQGGGASFLDHVRRIGGSKNGELFDEPDGELFGFGALQGIASAYNGAREAMRAEGDPVKDYYSQHFSSILNAGKSLVADLDAFVESDTATGKKLNGIGLDITGSDTISNDFLIEFETSDITPTIAVSSAFRTSIANLISSDNSALSFSVDYLKKYALGNVLLGMNEDEFFGRVLLDGIKSPELEAKLDEL